MVDTPSLEQLKKQAKDLLRAFRADDPLARKRVTLHLPQFATPVKNGSRDFLLAEALFVVARESGFPSWPKLKSHVEAKQGAGMNAFSGQSGSGWRKQLVERLATQAADLAKRREIEGLVRCLSGLPLQAVLQVRALLVEGGNYLTVVDALIEGLGHPNPGVRYECAGAMDHIADDRCVEPLRRLLDDPCPASAAWPCMHWAAMPAS